MADVPDTAAPLRGAIFDVDGVLVDSPHERAWSEALDELMRGDFAEVAARSSWRPGALDDAVYASLVAGRPREDGARAVLEHFGVPDPDRARTARYAEVKQALLKRLIAERAFAPFDDGIRLLERLKAAGLRVAAASSSRNAPALLRLVHVQGGAGPAVADVLDADLSGRPVAHGKPAPDIFLAAAAALGEQPAACVVVEDAPAGAAAARAGGMRCIGVDRLGNADDLRAAGATWVVRSLDDVPPLPLAGGPT
jgi:beta-phosphoglucomutase-like phosphatase (HAD superfamily)